MKSGFLDFLIRGDGVLADRGFNIEDLVTAKGAKLVIPAFLKGRSNFTFEEETKSKLITRARIHVERFNQRFQTFLFVNETVPHYNLPLISQAMYVACCLANFSNTLAN